MKKKKKRGMTTKKAKRKSRKLRKEKEAKYLSFEHERRLQLKREKDSAKISHSGLQTLNKRMKIIY